MSEIVNSEHLRQQALELRLYGLQSHWSELTQEHHPLLSKLIRWELDERQQRSLERRIKNSAASDRVLKAKS
ncbi:MAG: hypothetical protein L3J57_16205 [Desulfuromusa sp.]|nr:hypothetical protein [Desulfuromusa sp.]